MLIYDGKEFRNLEEQVQKNKEDIARHYEIDRVIADLGIRVLGKVPTVQDLPTSAAAYGDAYFIGDTSQMYVWTRANELIGEMQPYWLDIGNVFIAGPEGPQGPQGLQGERGERGSRWFAGNQLPTTASEYIEGDMFVLLGAGVPQSNVGNVYRFDGYSFTYHQNIRGPQGIQGLRGIQGPQGIQGPEGPQGPQGPASGIVNVVGTVSNAASLPSPSVLSDLKSAYLVGPQAPYQLYIQVGTTPANAVWVNQGYLQNTDDKVTISTSPYRVYATNSYGAQTVLKWSQQTTGESVAVRMPDGRVKVAPAVNDNDAVQKSQLPNLYRHNIYITDGPKEIHIKIIARRAEAFTNTTQLIFNENIVGPCLYIDYNAQGFPILMYLDRIDEEGTQYGIAYLFGQNNMEVIQFSANASIIDSVTEI